MSVIYRALRNKKRTDSAAPVQSDGGDDQALEEGEGGLVRSWLAYVQNRWVAFRGWFAEASPKIRAVVIVAPLLVLGLISGVAYWSITSVSGPGKQAVVEAKEGAVDGKLAEALTEEAAKAKKAEEDLFAGAAPGAEGAVSVAEEAVATVEEATQEESVEAAVEKMLAIFGDSSAPEQQEAEVRGAKESAGKEPAPIEVTPEEEAAAVGKRQKVAEVEETVVPPDVQESKEREIGRVVADLRLAMGRKDAKGVDQLFGQLGKIKSGGDTDPFILNMRAFWEISNGQYETAGALLKMVLERRKDDLEAGLNMAIVEMRTNRMVAARERLFALLRLYPGDARPGEMLRYFR